MSGRPRSGGGNAAQPPLQGGLASAFAQGYASSRVAVLFGVFLIAAALFVARLVYLQVIVASDYADRAVGERAFATTLSPKRGTIYDRNGRVLATSVEASTVYCNPHDVKDVDATARAIAEVLGGKPADYRGALSDKELSFAFIKRQADIGLAQKLREKDLDGIYFLPDMKRVYPNGSVGAQVVGLVNVDGEALTGLELYYDDILGGTPGEYYIEYGATGLTIQGSEYRVPAVDGKDIVISIDIDLQQRVEKDVADFAKDEKAKSGQGLVLDGATGEILACASTPLLDPTNLENMETRADELQCITRAFEPGSIFKTVTMCAALEEGSVTPSTSIFCPKELPADEYVVTDAFYRTSETMTTTQILARSSNIGMSLIAERMGFDVLNQKIHDYGLAAQPTGVDFPGESAGFLLDFDHWARIQGYNISFGQGISETPLNMARFYGAVVNDGVAFTPHFLIELPQGGDMPTWKSEKIIGNEKVLPDLQKMLMSVVTDGTGTAAEIPGYDAAGKTGTGEYIAEGHEEDGYLTDHYNVSFVGFLANSDSKLVCFAGATEVPGEPATTPVFQDIMSYAIERYNINSTQG